MAETIIDDTGGSMGSSGGTGSGSGATGAAASSTQNSTPASKESIQALNQRAHAAVDKAAERASQTADWLTGSRQDVTEKTTQYVKAKPLRAIGIAFASGLLLGKLLR